MERKIGEIFEYNGEWYQCVKGDCTKCDFFIKRGYVSPLNTVCGKRIRKDKQNVIFKKLEKVGEPHFIEDEIFEGDKVYVQNFKVYKDFEGHKPICNDYILYDWKNRIISIEIKQNKEDMEERELDPRMAKVIDEATQKMGEEIGRQIEANINKQRMKSFNLEQAKAGKPVCTRDGRKARIICFDLQSIEKTPIVAAVQVTDKQEVISHYYEDGRQFVDGISELDLMMLSEKKEGWVNVYKGGLLDTKSYPTKKEAFDKASPKGYVDTIKINWSE